MFEYSCRARAEDVLGNPNRERILQTIQRHPGIRAGTIAKLVALNYATVRFHLRILENAQVINGAGNGQRRYFVIGSLRSGREKTAAIVASSKSTKLILDNVSLHGAMTFMSLVKTLELPQSTASRAVAHLASAKLVCKERRGRRLVVAAVS